jgi:hypothetical protein
MNMKKWLTIAMIGLSLVFISQMSSAQKKMPGQGF